MSDALEKRFVSAVGDDMEMKLEKISKRFALKCCNNRREDILESVPGGFLEEFDRLNGKSDASVSVSYALMARCNLEPEKDFRHNDFRNAFNFNAPAVMSRPENAVSESAEQTLREIDKVVKSYERVRALSGGHRS